MSWCWGPEQQSATLDVLAEGQRRGLIGPGPLEPHIDHARGFALAARSVPAGRALDLGSGAGLPGLVLALGWPDTLWCLLDARKRAVTFLRQAVETLGVRSRVELLCGRAETSAHDPDYRAQFSLVTARGFGPPPVTAECGGGFLAVGGILLVSDPPDSGDRWPAGPLAELGLAVSEPVVAAGAHYRRLRRDSPVPSRYPRRTGVPARRPLF